ncbi:MAG: NAD(+) synthase [Spirochaetales bacterium]|nr:NAD(+) synthase [Spirochaetales bacterium]
MRLIKIGIANINTTVGAFKSNTEKIIFFMKKMNQEQCTIACFQEQAISGYPAEDLVQWKSFVSSQWECLERIAGESGNTKGIRTVYTLGLTVEHNGHLYNVNAVLCNGRILGIVPKEKLPTYGVFYEWRTFSPGIPGFMEKLGKMGIPFGDMIFSFPFGVIGVEVCEDIWSPDGPIRRRAYSGAEVIINASASPFRVGIVNTRKEVISTRAADNQAVVVYTNQYGGNDSLVFDGGGYINQNGLMIKEAPRWEEGFCTEIVDLNRTSRLRYENTTWRTDCKLYHETYHPVMMIESKEGPAANLEGYRFRIPANKSFFLPVKKEQRDPVQEYFNDLIQAMITGLDYFEKTKAFKKIGIALSGGKDSMLSLIICYLFAQKKFSNLSGNEKMKAIREYICCFSMPARYNSEETKSISAGICEELDVSFKEIPIQEAYENEMARVQAMLDQGEKLTEITKMNIQARIRGELMLNWSNSSGGMWIQTGNMSEKAVGYTTIGGDMMGAYSLIANIPKTVIIALLHSLYEKYKWKSVGAVLKSKASAELAENQEDEKDLMPFPVLDACMYLFVEEKKSPVCVYMILKSMWTDSEFKEMCPHYKQGMLKEWVKKFTRLFANSLFKWVLTPEAVHVGKLELDRERALQLPVVQSKEWLALDELDE